MTSPMHTLSLHYVISSSSADSACHLEDLLNCSLRYRQLNQAVKCPIQRTGTAGRSHVDWEAWDYGVKSCYGVGRWLVSIAVVVWMLHAG